MAEMRAVKGERELIWTDGAWSGDPQLVAIAEDWVASGEPVEIIPLPDLPADDDSCEVVGYIMNQAFGMVDQSPGPIYKDSTGMKTRTADWGQYDGSGRVY